MYVVVRADGRRYLGLDVLTKSRLVLITTGTDNTKEDITPRYAIPVASIQEWIKQLAALGRSARSARHDRMAADKACARSRLVRASH